MKEKSSAASIYYHEENYSLAEDVEQRMAVLSEVITSTTERMIDNVQVGDHGIPLDDDRRI